MAKYVILQNANDPYHCSVLDYAEDGMNLVFDVFEDAQQFAQDMRNPAKVLEINDG